MKKKKLTLTIGIPAYNEEANIKNLLLSLLAQEQTGFKINEIIVISDASNDKTVEEAKKVIDKRIKIIQNNSRKGQAYVQNLIFSKVKTDAVAILEADTLPGNENYLSEMIQPILSSSDIGMTQGNVLPVKPSTFFEEVIAKQLNIYRHISINYKNANSWLCTGRGGRIFTQKYYTKLRWPLNIPEDVFAFLWFKNKKIKTVFVPQAFCEFRIPQNFQDLLKERRKIESGKESLKKYFSQKEINNVYSRPSVLVIWMTIIFIVENPLYFLAYSFIKFRLKLIKQKNEFTDFWPKTNSTKILYN